MKKALVHTFQNLSGFHFFDTGLGFSWHHRCVAFRSSANRCAALVFSGIFKTKPVQVAGYILILFFALMSFSSKAQFAYNYLRAGDDYFRKGDYYSAAQYYEKYLNNNPSVKTQKFDPYTVAAGAKDKPTKKVSRQEVIYKTGESYQLLNNYVKAEPYFKEAVAFSAQFPLARYWLAKSLRSNSKFDEAEEEFKKFLQEYSTTDDFKDDANKELQNLQFRQSELKKKDLAYYTVSKLPLNSIGATSAPALMNGAIVFSSTRPDSSAPGKSPFINRLYQSNGDSSSVVKLSIPQAKEEHIEGATFSVDGSKMFMTKWSIKDNKKTAAIYTSSRQNDGWSEPVLLDNNINSEGYNSQQPFVTAENYLYYSSNKPGGIGKYDIWVSKINADGKTDVSTNLASVNSKEDEYAPSFFTPEQTLIFSSNGRTGMGGFDFYEAKNSPSGWQEPVNLGYPVNSVKDEIYVVSTGTKHLMDNILFSSDRASECCLELFSANKRTPVKRIAGVVLDCSTGQPLPDVSVSITDANNSAIANKTTDQQGRYEIVLEEYQALKVNAQQKGYLPKGNEIAKPLNDLDTLVTTSICIEKPPFVENKPIVIQNVYFDFNKATLKPGSFIVLDSVVAILERFPTMVIEVRGHTDSKGSEKLNLALSEARAKAFADYLITKGIDASRLTSKGYGATIPIAPNKLSNGKDNPAGRDKNRRTEIKVLHY